MTTAYRTSSNLQSTSRRLVGGIGVALALLGATPALAGHLVTPVDLRNACQTSPGNVVVLTHPVKIVGSDPSSIPRELVLTGCTIVIGANAKLEADKVSMGFAGPLVVESSEKAEIKLSGSYFEAPSVNFNLTGTGSAIETTLTSIRARAGSVLITMGDQSKLIVQEWLGTAFSALNATTTVRIHGGQKFIGQFNHMRINAPDGIEISMNGAEGLLKVEQVLFWAEQGSIGITASGIKGQVGMSESDLRFGDMLSIRLAGADSSVRLKQTSANRSYGSGPDTPGGLVIESGSGAAANGKIEASEVRFDNVATIRLLGSLGGLNGGLKMEKSFVRASGAIEMETGAQGVTEVKENSVHAGTRIRVASGAGGKCIGQPNGFFAPVVVSCP